MAGVRGVKPTAVAGVRGRKPTVQAALLPRRGHGRAVGGFRRAAMCALLPPLHPLEAGLLHVFVHLVVQLAHHLQILLEVRVHLIAAAVIPQPDLLGISLVLIGRWTGAFAGQRSPKPLLKFVQLIQQRLLQLVLNHGHRLVDGLLFWGIIPDGLEAWGPVWPRLHYLRRHACLAMAVQFGGFIPIQPPDVVDQVLICSVVIFHVQDLLLIGLHLAFVKHRHTGPPVHPLVRHVPPPPLDPDDVIPYPLVLL
mmetsp:Transcript_10544/g.18649  ORF Transcript_10544/g.18649 Transcript_10544/m.18649 type:complete len:252 (+) Transcript_10544:8614-9369(+)